MKIVYFGILVFFFVQQHQQSNAAAVRKQPAYGTPIYSNSYLPAAMQVIFHAVGQLKNMEIDDIDQTLSSSTSTTTTTTTTTTNIPPTSPHEPGQHQPIIDQSMTYSITSNDALTNSDELSTDKTVFVEGSTISSILSTESVEVSTSSPAPLNEVSTPSPDTLTESTELPTSSLPSTFVTSDDMAESFATTYESTENSSEIKPELYEATTSRDNEAGTPEENYATPEINHEIHEHAQEIQEPVQEIEEPVQEIQEPVQEIQEPVQEIQEPVQEIQEPVKEVQEPVHEMTESNQEMAENSGDYVTSSMKVDNADELGTNPTTTTTTTILPKEEEEEEEDENSGEKSSDETKDEKKSSEESKEDSSESNSSEESRKKEPDSSEEEDDEIRFTLIGEKVSQVPRPSLSNYLRKTAKSPLRSSVEELATLYDALSKDARRQGLAKYSGYSDEVLKTLETSAEGGVGPQLRTLLEMTLERKELTRQDAEIKLKATLEKLKDPATVLSRDLRRVVPLRYVP